MADSPQLPDEIQPRRRWFGIASRTARRNLRDAETPATDAEAEGQDEGGYNAHVMPTYRIYTPAEQRDAVRHYSASWAGYFGNAPHTKIADETMQLPVAGDRYIFTGEEHQRNAGQFTAQVSRGPTKPYAGQPPASTTIARNVAGQSVNDPRSMPTGSADMAAWLMQGDF